MAGASPKMTLVRKEAAKAKPSARPSMPSAFNRGFTALRYSGRPPRIKSEPHKATISPAAPPSNPSNKLSVNICRISLIATEDGVHLRLRLIDSHARFEPRNHRRQIIVILIRFRFGVERERRPDFYVLG